MNAGLALKKEARGIETCAKPELQGQNAAYLPPGAALPSLLPLLQRPAPALRTDPLPRRFLVSFETVTPGIALMAFTRDGDIESDGASVTRTEMRFQPPY